jgi:putative DNA primase/helicase
VPAFDPQWLPEPLRGWGCDIAERMQAPIDFVAVSALVAAGALVGRQIGLRPKREDDWIVVPNLWGLIIGGPGSAKTPAMTAGLTPLYRLVAEAQKVHQAAREDHNATHEIKEAQRSALKGKLRTAINKGAPTDDIEGEYKAVEDDPEPREHRYLVNDATTEKLGELFIDNPNGLLLVRDEIGGLLEMMEREGHQNDRAFYCEAWNGNSSYSVDRIGRGSLTIPALCLSILGTIQPGKLRPYLRAAVQGGVGDDGLIQRFQLAVYPDISPFTHVDRWPNRETREQAFQVYQALAALDLRAFDMDLSDPGELPFLRFTGEAQGIFNTWYVRLMGRLRSDTPHSEHPIIASHLVKYASLMPSLALLFHLIDGVGRGRLGPVSKHSAARAIAWCTYLEAHARRIYQDVTDRGGAAADALAARLRAGRLTSPFTVYDIRRRQWAGLEKREDILPGLALLEDLHWVRPVPRERGEEGGRPTEDYFINPKILQIHENR